MINLNASVCFLTTVYYISDDIKAIVDNINV